MNFNELEELIERYYDGKTTLEQERQLREWALGGDIDERLAGEAKLLREIWGEKSNSSDEMALFFEKKVNEWVAADAPRKGRKFRLSRPWRLGIAASLLVACGVGFALYRQSPAEQPAQLDPRDTFDNPEEAAQATCQALAKLSECMDRGLAHGDEALAKALGEMENEP